MNKSTLLVLALAMLVPTVALADGVTVGGDLRLRWDYAGPETSDSSNSSSAVTNIDLDAAINDNVSFAVSLRNDLAFGDGVGGEFGLQEAYASVGDLGSASGMLAGWSLDVGRMNNPDGGRIINSDDWGQAAPASNDGYHLASDMGGIGIGVWYFGGGNSPAGGADSMLGAAFDLGDMAGGFADIDVAYWSSSAAADTSNVGININNIASENLAGVDLDVTYATRDNDTADDGTLTGISVGYAMEGFDLSFSNTVADADWNAFSDAAHGTNGIADMNVGSNAAGADVDNTTIGASFSPVDGVTASVDFITLAQDSSGDDIGTEMDVVLGWECGSDVHMTIGYASFSADDASALEDCDYFYLQTGWAF
ncbi:MAG TPA: hypothetical protein EYQ08_06425 [Planctomycetes bacterium]|nr:hypothetical protein [Planctomycetota bacterium]